MPMHELTPAGASRSRKALASARYGTCPPFFGIRLIWRTLILWLAGLLSCSALAAEPVLHIGSKRFTESYILGEIVRQSAAPFVKAEHAQGLGNTAVVLAALQSGSIDVYPEYTGTIEFEILRHDKPVSPDTMRAELAQRGLGMAVPLGFNNTYALAMRADDAARQGITRISDLARKRDLRFGLSPEFMGRNDGWPSLTQRYALPQTPHGLENGVAYEALQQGQVDVIDVYSTSSKIGKYGLRVLLDDRGHFPRYDAVLLYRLGTEQRFPRAWQAVLALEGRIHEADMMVMNAAAELDGKSFGQVAQDFLAHRAPAQRVQSGVVNPGSGISAAGIASSAAISVPGSGTRQAATPVAAAPSQPDGSPARASLWQLLTDDKARQLTMQHLRLVGLSLLLACLLALPLGILAAFTPRLRQVVMAVVGVLQTVPALALLTMLIALLGQIGMLPALVALVLYALLPIVRNTCTGLLQVPAGLRMAALALGLTRRQRLLHIDLPLALPTILAGVKTAAVMCVGTATIAAFIGAGGYGERIVIGLALNDNRMLLAGAIPSALLALLTQALFEWLERSLVRKHARGA